MSGRSSTRACIIAISGSDIGPACCGGSCPAATACSSASVFSLSPNGGRPSIAAYSVAPRENTSDAPVGS